MAVKMHKQVTDHGCKWNSNASIHQTNQAYTGRLKLSQTQPITAYCLHPPRPTTHNNKAGNTQKGTKHYPTKQVCGLQNSYLLTQSPNSKSTPNTADNRMFKDKSSIVTL